MITSENIGNLAEALAKAQGVMTAAKMDAVNPFLKNKYADLGSVIQATRKALADNGLSITQHPAMETDLTTLTLTTRLMHASGEWIESDMTVGIGDEKGISQVQSMGKAITYMRRYALSSILGVYADEDTDGNDTGKKAESKPRRTEADINAEITGERKERAELAPAALKGMLAKIAEDNKTKPLPAELQHTPACMEQVLGGESQRKELLHYLTGKNSFSPAKPDLYIGDGYVMALHRWLKPTYVQDTKSFDVSLVSQREMIAAHQEALKDAGQAELEL